jgi:transposase
MAAVMIGVDPHKGSHTAVVIDQGEMALDQVKVRACAAQAERLLAWAASWPERTGAVEGAGGLGHLLAQQLVAVGERVLDVQPELAARVRLLAAGDVNKNDPNDARSVAVAALRSAACPPVRADDHAAVLKIWAKRHRDLSRARNQVVCRMHAVLCELVPGGVSKRITAAQAARVLEAAEPRGAAGAARWQLAAQYLTDLRRIDIQRRDIQRRLAAAVRASGTTVTDIFGVGPAVAAAVIGDTCDIARFPGPDCFAAYNGTAPVEVSSGNRVIYPAVAAREPADESRHPHSSGHPDPLPAHQRPRVLRQETGRGQDRQRGAAGTQTAGQRCSLSADESRRAPRRGPGRAPGERLCRQRGRLTPRTPALRPGHSRTCLHPTTAARPVQSYLPRQFPPDQELRTRSHIQLTLGSRAPAKVACRAPPGAGPGLPALPAPGAVEAPGSTGGRRPSRASAMRSTPEAGGTAP